MQLRPMRPAQVQAWEYARPKSRIALFMEMRLGKSLVAIRWARHHRLERVLVVVPNDLIEDWREELLREGVDDADIYVMHGSRLSKLWQASEIDSGWCIINYEAVRSMGRRNLNTGAKQRDLVSERLLRLPWSGILLDESTAIRIPNSSTTATMLRYTTHINHRCLMSGLPNPQSELDYFTQMVFLHGSFMGHHNYWAFRNRFFFPDVYGWNWAPKKGVREEIKKAVHANAFVLSRKSAGVGEMRVRERRYVEMTRSQRSMYRRVEKDFVFKDLRAPEDQIETTWATVKYTWMQRIAGGFSPDREHPRCLSDMKIKSLINLLRGELLREYVVVWFRFNEELWAVEAALKAIRISCATIHGGPGRRPINVKNKNRFKKGEVRVLLCQIRMGKYGWDLSISSTNIYYSNSEDLELRMQSQDRVVSVAKKEPILDIDLVTRDSIDEDTLDLLLDKRVSAQTFNTLMRQRIMDAYRRHSGRPIPVRRVMPGDQN